MVGVARTQKEGCSHESETAAHGVPETSPDGIAKLPLPRVARLEE